MKDLRSENDNLREWRLKKQELTERLLKRSLDELITIRAIINQKSVCEMMQKIATTDEIEHKALISPSAISKNDTYKNMILEAKEKIKINGGKSNIYKLDADKKLEVFQLKTIIAKKEAKIKEFESIINRANIKTNNALNQDVINEDIDYKRILEEVIVFMIKDGSVYVDSQDNLLREDTQDILISNKVFKSLEIRS